MSANNLRDGWDQNETTGALAPAVVKGTSTFNGGTFGELFSAVLDGQVYAQPIVAGGTLIVATENDWVYGLNPTTGAVRWKVSLGTPWPVQAGHLCKDLTPSIGVTGTPVYDSAHGIVYLVSEQVLNGDALHPVFFMNALDPATGQEEPNWPVRIHGPTSNDPTVPFTAINQLQRPGLLLLGGSVYAAFGSHCDYQPYQGYVVGVAGANTANPGAVTMWSDESGVADAQAGIWQSGGGLMSDGAGRIFFASGNGISPAPGPGSKPPSELAESVVKLVVLKDGTLAAKDFFSPANAAYLDSIDGDFGSGAPVGLPFGTTALPKMLVIAGKADGLFVLNRNNLGGRQQGPDKGDAAVSEVGKRLPGQWGHPAAFADTPVLSTFSLGHDYVYYLGKSDVLRYFKAVLGGPRGVTPELVNVAQSSDKFGYTSGSPVVTSNGTNAKTGVVWVVRSSDENGTTGTLQAFPVVPPGTCSVTKPCTVSPLWTSAPFSGAGKFTVPATDDGHVYVASRGIVSNGTNCPTVPSGDYCAQVLGFGSPSKVPLTAPTVPSFSYVPVGTASSAKQVTITNTSKVPVTVESAPTTTAGFAVAGPFDYTLNGHASVPASWPQVLNPADSLTVHGITFDPTSPGGYNGSLQISTGSANFPAVGVGLTGTGTQLGFYASASSVSFGTDTPVGTTAQQQVTVTNGESVPVTLTTTAQPGAPFSVSGLPADGTTVQPGQSELLTVSYHPSGTSGDSDSLTLTANDGTNQTPTVVSLTGTGATDIEPTLTAAPTSVSFGSVLLGHNAQQVVTVTNTGNLPAVISATSPPGIPFGAPDPIANGLPVNPGYSVQIPITFVPTSVGSVSAQYQLTWTDTQGSHSITIPVTGTGAAPAGVAVPPPGGGWTFNGSARMTGTSLSLTQVVKDQAGSADYSVPVPSDGLKATFTAALNGGTGGNGLTFALLDASKNGQRAVGGKGSQLGFGGLAGVAVTLNTSKDAPSYPSSSFVSVATSTAGGTMHFASTANVPGLRTGSHKIGVSVSGGKVTVTVDGKQVLSRAIVLPPTVRIAFTGGTGVKDDNHLVSAATITSAGHRIPAPGGGWSYNGVATTSGSDTRLTPALTNKAGSVVYSAPVQAVGLRVTFDAQLGGGTGGDGLTFALLNPATTKSSTVGAPGPMLGLGTSAGVPGLGVVLATDGPASPAGFVATSVAIGSDGLRFQRKAQGIGMLTTGTHIVTVNVTKSNTKGVVVTVYLDGVQVLQEAEPTLTSTVRLAFTAGTGATTDVHIVRSAAISASG